MAFFRSIFSATDDSHTVLAQIEAQYSIDKIKILPNGLLFAYKYSEIMLWDLATKQQVATTKINVSYPKFSFPNKDLILIFTNFGELKAAYNATTLEKVNLNQISAKIAQAEMKLIIEEKEEFSELARIKNPSPPWAFIQRQECNAKIYDSHFTSNCAYALPDNEHLLFKVDERRTKEKWIPIKLAYGFIPVEDKTYEYRRDHLFVYNKTTHQLTKVDLNAEYIWKLDIDCDGRILALASINKAIYFMHIDLEVMKKYREAIPATIYNSYSSLGAPRAVANIVLDYLDMKCFSKNDEENTLQKINETCSSLKPKY